jgi:hypothetical protein
MGVLVMAILLVFTVLLLEFRTSTSHSPSSPAPYWR